jgi:6-phosphogluconolactonase
MANYELISFASAEELARAAAGDWLDEIEAANHAGKQHCVALSGGRIAHQFYAAVAGQAKLRNVPFDCVHFFWADERCVSPTDSESNFKLANDRLFAPLNISATQIHRLRGEIAPAEAVKSAEAELLCVVPSNEKKFPALDLVFLGMGEDGHVASLFPGAMVKNLDTSVPFLVVEDAPKPPPRRISMSYTALKNACKIWVFVAGGSKESALRESLLPEGRTPLAQVIRLRRDTKIFSDFPVK